MDQALHQQLAAWRRHLHRNPELSLQERETAAFVCARLDELGIPYVGGVGGHGVVATLARGGGNTASIGLRADMDALPIAEQTGLAHASRHPGVMHACGHDGHTVSLLGAAALLAGDASWTGTVRLVFQPAEEGAGGAKAMIDDGLFARFPMQRIFGFHNWPGLEAGTVMLHDGPVMAAGARVSLLVSGKAAHAAMPHLGRDPLLAAAHILVGLQSIVSRAIDPLDAGVVSICMLQSGTAANQIPDSALMRGTLRAHREPVMDRLEAELRRIAEGTALAQGVAVDVAVDRALPVTANARAETDLAAQAAQGAGLTLRRDLPPSMAGEDFAWLARECPGAFAWIGNGAEGAELHSPHYDFNDAILPVAATYLAAVARQALA